MLDVTPKNLRLEVEASIERRRHVTDRARTLLRAFAGLLHQPDENGPRESYENLSFEYAAVLVPKIMFDNPAVSVTMGEMGDIKNVLTETMEAGLNANIRATRMVRKLRRIILDMLFSFGVAETYVEPVPGWDEDRELNMNDPMRDGTIPLRPSVARVSPFHAFIDWGCEHWTEARYMGKIWVRDQQDLLDAVDAEGQPVYNAEVVKAAGLNAGLDELKAKLIEDGIDFRKVERNCIVGYEIHVPETGMLYEIPFSATDVGGGYLREPRRYGGPRRGPWTVFGLYDLPDSPYPIPNLQVLYPLINEINAHAMKAGRDAADAKRLYFVDSEIPGLIDNVVQAAHGSVFGIPGGAAAVTQADIGGQQASTLTHLQMLRARADRQLGISATERSDVSGGQTATADLIAQQGGEVRSSDNAKQVRGAVIDVLESMAYIMWNVPQVRMRVPFKGADGVMREQTFVGGVAPGQNPMDFYRLNFHIEPYSMEMVSQAVLQKRAQDKTQLLASIFPLIPQAPAFWAKVLNDYGEAFNQKGMGDQYVSAMIGQAPPQMGMPMQQPTMGPPQAQPPAPSMNESPQAGTQRPTPGGLAGGTARLGLAV